MSLSRVNAECLASSEPQVRNAEDRQHSYTADPLSGVPSISIITLVFAVHPRFTGHTTATRVSAIESYLLNINSGKYCRGREET